MSYVPESKLGARRGHSRSRAGSECFVFSGTSSSHLLAALLNFPKIHQTRLTVKYSTVIWEIRSWRHTQFSAIRSQEPPLLLAHC